MILLYNPEWDNLEWQQQNAHKAIYNDNNRRSVYTEQKNKSVLLLLLYLYFLFVFGIVTANLLLPEHFKLFLFHHMGFMVPSSVGMGGERSRWRFDQKNISHHNKIYFCSQFCVWFKRKNHEILQTICNDWWHLQWHQMEHR